MALLAVLILIPVMGFLARGTIVSSWPPSALLYEKIGLPVTPPGKDLLLAEVKAEQRMQGDLRILSIQGEVANLGTETKELPPLLAKLVDVEGTRIDAVEFQADAGILEPGELTGFFVEMVVTDERISDAIVTFH